MMIQIMEDLEKGRDRKKLGEMEEGAQYLKCFEK